MRLEQVREFSEKVSIEMVRDWTDTAFLGAIGTVFLMASILLARELWKNRKEGLGPCIVLGSAGMMVSSIAFVLIFGAVTYAYKPAEGEILKYKAKQTQWVREYVNPYIEGLKKQEEKLNHIEYNYVLGEKNQKNSLEKDYDTPIRAITKSGETISGWAQIKPIAEGETERLEYVKLGHDLNFGNETRIRGFNEKSGFNEKKEFKAGYYKMVVYTDTFD